MIPVSTRYRGAVRGNQQMQRLSHSLSAIAFIAASMGPHAWAQNSGTIPEGMFRSDSPGVLAPEAAPEPAKPKATFKGYNSLDPNTQPKFPSQQPTASTLPGGTGAPSGSVDSEDLPDTGGETGANLGDLSGLSKEQKALLKPLMGEILGSKLEITGSSGGNKAQDHLKALEAIERYEIQNADKAMNGMLQRWKGAHPDSRLQKALADFIAPVISQAQRKNLPWRVALTRSGVPNASATFGGQIAVNPGLIAISSHPGELLGVVFHEVGHVDLRHSVRSLEDSANLQIALNADGEPDHQAIASLMNAQADKAFFGYSRVKEAQADEYMLQSMSRLNLDLRKAGGLWVKLLSKSGGTDANRYYERGSHPAREDRLRRILDYASNQPQGVQDPGNWPGWAALKAAFPTPPEWQTEYLANGDITVGGRPFDWALLNKKFGIMAGNE